MCRVLQPYTKEELQDMHRQGDSDMGIKPGGSSRQQEGSRSSEEVSRHDRVFVPHLGWVDQSEAQLEGM